MPDPALQRAALRRDGFVHVPGALSHDAVARLRAALDRVYDRECDAGRLRAGEAMHLLGGIDREPAFLELLDHHAVFPIIWGELGWNIHVYHCHLDVTPRITESPPTKWGWHQDGGRQNLELETEPRPRLSLKVAWWLTDVRSARAGNMLVIPGSHARNRLPRPERPENGFEPPPGAQPVFARAGDAFVFDRRLWHSRSDNIDGPTRKAIFLAYTYRWVRPRDEIVVGGVEPISPVRRQLLGAGGPAQSFWGLGRDAVPLRRELERRDLLDPAVAAHR